MIFALGTARLYGDTSISGSLVVNAVEKLTGSVNLTFNEDFIPSNPPTGLETGHPEPIKGTWQEI